MSGQEGEMEPELEDHEHLKDTFTHLNMAEVELRNALRAALDAGASASLLRKIGDALAEVSYLIPWSASLAEDHERAGG
jgi:hypothetical protein